jgi:hypothetical protein
MSQAQKTRKGRMTAKEFAKKTFKGKNLGTIEQIVKLGMKGFTQKEIIDAGYNRNTVYRQYREQVANA